MKLINKINEPDWLVDYKQQYPQTNYDNASGQIKQSIREACTQEQYFLCAYCCKRISGVGDSGTNGGDTTNEHITPQSVNPSATLDFSNIVASCSTKNQCNHARGNQELLITPLMAQCETEFEFSISGEVVGKTKRAEDAIQILKLNSKNLCYDRKQLIDALELDKEKDEQLLLLCNKMLIPDQQGKLDAYAPDIVNAIKNWIFK